MFTVKVEDQASALFGGLAMTVTDMLQTQVDEISNVMTPLVKQNAPIGKHYNYDGSITYGGQLRDSLRMVGGFLGSYLMGARQGIFVAAGTRPHPISPRGARSVVSTHEELPQFAHLTFYWSKVGRTVTPPHVNHPGNKANDFRWKAVQEGFDTEAIPDTIARIMDQWLSGNG